MLPKEAVMVIKHLLGKQPLPIDYDGSHGQFTATLMAWAGRVKTQRRPPGLIRC